MPTTTLPTKVERTGRPWAPTWCWAGNVYDEAYEHALKLAEENSYTFIHPFNDPRRHGPGTIATEIVQELPLVDYILRPSAAAGLPRACPRWPSCSTPTSRSSAWSLPAQHA